jgi:hypothetical protein
MPGNSSEGLPAAVASMDEGSPSTPRDAGQADARAPGDDPPGLVEVPECLGLALQLDGTGQTADGSALGVTATLAGNPTYVTSTALCTPGQAL